MSDKRHISVEKTATYQVLGNLKSAKRIWFVLHGYGMLAEFFIKKFDPIISDDVAVVAPEALSKFYTKGFYGRVGATWMTKQDREIEIKDYISYLNKLHQFVLTENNHIAEKINLLGFSQGGATVSRWASANQIKFDNLILWASVFPDDMNFNNIKSDNTFLIYGDEDEFSAHERIIELNEKLNKLGVTCQIEQFKGNHNIPKEALISFNQKFDW